MKSGIQRWRVVTACSLVVALLASGCSSTSSRNAGLFGGSDDALSLPALTPVASGANQITNPVFNNSVLGVSDGSLVATSTQPTLDARVVTVNGVARKPKKFPKASANGSWQFFVGNLTADPNSSQGWESIPATAQNGTTRVPKNVLQDGRAYQWRAVSSSGQQIRPTAFTVDTTRTKQQPADTFSGIGVELASGRAHYTIQSHQVNSASGGVGVGLDYEAGNDHWPGMPANWRLVVPNVVTWDQLVVENDSASVISLHSKSGEWVTYRSSGNGVYEPLWRRATPAPTGQFPTVVRNDQDKDQPWTVTDVSQTVTTFGPAHADTKIAQVGSVTLSSVLSLQQSYDDAGRVTAIKDPVSQRSVELIYGGDDCPSFGDGFIDTPDGLLCRVKFWDDSQTWVGYVDTAMGPQVGRLADNPETAGVAVADFAYDQSGRLAANRSALTAQLQAAGQAPKDDSMLTQLQYDSNGRVQQITGPMPRVGGQRMARSYSYLDSNQTVSNIVEIGSGKKTLLTSTAYDPNTFNVTSVKDVDGRTSTNTWDAAGNMIKQVSPTGTTKQNEYDSLGRIVSEVGPSVDIGSNSQKTTYSYDQSFKSATAKGEDWQGLQFQLWTNDKWSGNPNSAALGPALASGAIPDIMQVSWSSNPPGSGSGPWSGRLSGNLTIDKSDVYSVAANGATLWLDGTKCDGGCKNIKLDAGLHTVRMDLSAPKGGGAGVSLLLNTGSTTPTKPVPMAKLSPNYGLRTQQSAVDYAQSGVRTLATVTQFNQPANSQATQLLNQAGFGMKSSYEGLDQSAGQYGRPTAVTQPLGNKTAFSYWGGTEKASPDGCSDHGSAVQGGLPSVIADPNSETGDANGLRYQQWYNASGAPVAQKNATLPIKCFHYDDAGRVVSTVQGDGSTQERADIDYAVDGNPLRSRATFTVDDGVTGSKEFTTEVTNDLAGRPIKVVDAFGTESTTTYDDISGLPLVSVTKVNPGSQSAYVVTTTNTYATNGALTKVTVTDNRGSEPVTAVKTFRNNGLLDTVTYSNGVKSNITYDTNQRPTTVKWTNGAGATWSAGRNYAPSGRAISESMSAASKSASWKYDYDLAGRLTSAKLDTAVPGLPKLWNYTHDTNGNRTEQKVDGKSTTYSYDKADRLTKLTGDPVLSGDVQYDQNGSITKIGPLEIAYGIDGQVSTVNDTAKKIRVSYLRDGDSNILAKKVEANGQTTTVKYTMDGVVLNDQNQPYLQQISLPGGVVVQKAIPQVQSGGAPARSAGAQEPDSANANSSESPSAAAQEPKNESEAPSGTPSAKPSDVQPESAPPAASEAPSNAPTPAETTPTPAEPQAPATAGPPPLTTSWLFESFAGSNFYQTDSKGNGTTELMLYDPFGQSLAALPAASAAPTLRWMTAQMIESEALSTQISVLGQRLYLPALGRFTSVDPKQGGSINAYDYASQDPINVADTNGRSPFDTFMWSLIGGLAASIATSTVLGIAAKAAFGLGASTSVMTYVAVNMVIGVASQTVGIATSNGISGAPWDWQSFGIAASIGAFTGAIGGALAKEGALLEEASAARQSHITAVRQQYDSERYAFEQARANPRGIGAVSAGIDKGVNFLGSALTGAEGQGGITTTNYLNSVAIKVLVTPQLWLSQYHSWKRSECAQHEVVLKYFGDVCKSES